MSKTLEQFLGALYDGVITTSELRPAMKKKEPSR